MSYVQPTGVIQLFRGINLDNRYMHTIYFANEAAQNTWFSSRVTYNFNNQMKTRHNGNKIKLKIACETIADCTYLRFQNVSNSKWYYAFIIGVNYISENTTEIIYEIDVMQTWFIQNGSIAPCMVLREHVNNDTFGLHLEDEPIGSTEYECDSVPYTSADGLLFNDYRLIVNTSEEPVVGDIINNRLVNGTKFYSLDASNANAVWNEISALITLINGSWDSGDKPIEIIDMFTFPSKFANMNINDNTHIIEVSQPATLNGYTPKNKKLLTYPFSYMQGTTMNGSACLYRWEYFPSVNDIQFRCYGNPIGGGQIQCYPTNYDGVINNIDAALVMDDFPKNPFAYDAYQAWVAAGGKTRLEREQLITNIRGATALVSASSNAYMSGVRGISQLGYNAVSLGDTDSPVMANMSGMARGANSMTQGAAGLVNTITDIMEAKNKIEYQWKDAKYQPNIVVGTATPNLAVANRELNFHFYSVHVKVEELPRLDDFFSCYGYAINKVKAPNLTGRQYFNFVQTQNAIINGNMPSSSKEAIGRIFDGGITFWHDGDKVGNYMQSVSSGSINNPIVS